MIFKLSNKSLQMKKLPINAFCGSNYRIIIPCNVPASGFLLGLPGLQVWSQCPEPSPPSKITLANQLGVWLWEIQLPCCCWAWRATQDFTMAASNEYQSMDQMRTITSAKSYRVEGLVDIYLSQNTPKRKPYSGDGSRQMCNSVSRVLPFSVSRSSIIIIAWTKFYGYVYCYHTCLALPLLNRYF